MRDRVSTLPRALLACACLIVVPAMATAGDLHLQPGIFVDPQFDPKVALGASVSHVSGIAHEYVFSNGGNHKLSELDWQINDVLMLNASLGIRLTPWVALKLDGGTKLAGESDLVDSDWVSHGLIRDHWSHSTDTTVKSANRVDFSGNLSLYRHPHFTLDAVAGVRWNEWEFQAQGGTYIYSSTGHLNDQIGDFVSGETGIITKQNLVTPYLGLAFNAMWDRFALDGTLIGSRYSTAHNYDQHILRKDVSPTGFVAQTTVHNQDYYDYKFNGSYRYSDRVSITVGWEREIYQLATSGVSYYTGGVGANGAGGGFIDTVGGPIIGSDNATDRYSVGLTYKLN